MNGTASLGFAPPTVGRWRLGATYDGTLATAPNESHGFATLLVANPLQD